MFYPFIFCAINSIHVIIFDTTVPVKHKWKTIYRQIEMNKKERNSRRTKRNFIQIFAFQFIQVIYAMIYIKNKRVIQNSIIYHKNYVEILKYFSNKNIQIIYIFQQFHYYLSVFIYWNVYTISKYILIK